jgi:hypothetical protein
LIVETADRKHRIYYLHIDASEMKEGAVFKKGDPIGRASDNNCGHFADHGPHVHIFTTPAASISEIGASSTGEQVDYSPDPERAFMKVIRFFVTVLRCI